MLEWMHDKSVVENMQTDFASKTIDDCRTFIENSYDENKSVHLAITDDSDIYMGTASLKNINNNTAEFAITVRSEAMGKGYSIYGMNNIISFGFEQLKLKKIYWCVNGDNKRAVRFYDKNGFIRINIYENSLIDIIRSNGIYTEEQIFKYIWYVVEK